MIALGVETSHDQGSVGLAQDKKLLGEIVFSTALGPGERLVLAIDSLLQLNGVTRQQLDLICVALGPGSFTSLRMGMAVAKGVAQARSIPLIGIPTANAYAERVSFGDDLVWVILKDRRDLVYRALFQQNRQIEPAASLNLAALLVELRARPALCVGSGAEHHRAELEAVATIAPTALNQPSGAVIAQLGIRKFSITPQDELWALEPLYVQRLLVENVT